VQNSAQSRRPKCLSRACVHPRYMYTRYSSDKRSHDRVRFECCCRSKPHGRSRTFCAHEIGSLSQQRVPASLDYKPLQLLGAHLLYAPEISAPFLYRSVICHFRMSTWVVGEGHCCVAPVSIFAISAWTRHDLLRNFCKRIWPEVSFPFHTDCAFLFL
jgi:hypothetical protein